MDTVMQGAEGLLHQDPVRIGTASRSLRIRLLLLIAVVAILPLLALLVSTPISADALAAPLAALLLLLAFAWWLAPRVAAMLTPPDIVTDAVLEFYERAPGALAFVDNDLRFVQMNATMRTLAGSPRSRMAGRTVAECLPELAAQLESHMRRTVETGEPVLGVEVSMPAGTAGDTRHWDGSCHPVHARDGRRVGFGLRLFDSTERKRVEAQRRANEALWRAITDSSRIGMSIITPAGAAVYSNPALLKLHRLPLEQGEHAAWVKLVHEQDRERVGQAWREFQVNDEPYDTEFRLVVGGGDVRTVHATGTRIVEGGRQLGFVETLEDITERRHAEEALKSLNATLEQRVRERTDELHAVIEELEAFSYSVSHDLRAPLRAIHGFSQLLESDCFHSLDLRACDYLGRICAEARRMGQLIDDLIRLSQVSRSEMRHAPVDLSALASDKLVELRRVDPARRADLRIAPALRCAGDENLLRIVMDNLIDNAWKYSRNREVTRIGFDVQRMDGRDVYVVRDNGVGFDMEYASKLFAAFSRLHSSQDFEGTGIGLATVRRIVHRHGGRIWAEAAPDQGAAFYFTLGETEKRE